MRTSRFVSLGRLAAGLAFLAYVVVQSPHLVHHLFEHAETQTDCAFATAGERLPGLTIAADDLTTEQQWDRAAEARRPPAPTTRALAPAGPRAPPPLAS